MKLDTSLGVAIFTDGSCYYRNKTGGWAWVALDAFEGTHVASGRFTDVTNNQMELFAPTHALLTLFGAFNSLDVLVYSDSEYVVLGAMDRTRARKKNRDWWTDLDDAVSLHNLVHFEHIRGHAGHEYNELADELAGNARKGK